MESNHDIADGPESSPASPFAATEANTESSDQSPVRRVLPVNFVSDAAAAMEAVETDAAATTPDRHVDIYAAGRGTVAPQRTAKKITFFDDGKLFEGHLTVQSRNLKAIMQYLVDRQAEQTVIIEDLQHQMQTMRNRNAKKRRLGAFGYGAAGAGGLGGGAEALEQRVALLESFVRLWGVRPEEVEQLVKDYGDPVITPEPYTSYLLDLAPFRTARREARSLLTSTTGRPSISLAAVATAGDTGTRRAVTQRPSASAAGPMDARGGDDAVAQHALEVAAEALRRVEELSGSDHKAPTRAPVPTENRAKGRTDNAAASPPPPSSTTGLSVDVQARQEIAELGDYVMDRFRELEARGSLPAATATSSSRKASPGKGKSGTALPSSSATAVANSGVDDVAREDAAASLEMIGELEVYVEKRFKELSTAIANVALRKNAAPAAPAAAPAPSPAERDSGPSRKGKKSSRAASPATPPSDSLVTANAHHALAPSPPPPPPPPQPMGPFEDAVAREETVVLNDRLDDLEGELNSRFQAFEERLRIVGRASMQPKAAQGGAGSSGPSIDRKAREDASMSLMRVQQLERELTALKRQLALATGTPNSNTNGSAAAAALGSEEASRQGELPIALAPPADLKDTYNTRVQDLEKEVAQRMAEVNRAISMLKTSPGSDPYQQSLLDLLAGQTLFSQAAIPSPGAARPAADVSLGGAGDASNSAISSLPGHSGAASASAALPDGREAAGPHTLVLRSRAADDEQDGADDLDPFGGGGGLARGLVLPHRVTVSRLRPPDAPLMGVPLVERDVDVDRLLADWAPPPLPARTSVGSGGAAAAAPPRDGAAVEAQVARDSQLPDVTISVRTSMSPGKGQHATASPHLPALPPSPTPSGGGRRSPVPTAGVAAAASPLVPVNSARRPTATAALGHTKPCVILNCAWCAAEKQSARTATA